MMALLNPRGSFQDGITVISVVAGQVPGPKYLLEVARAFLLTQDLDHLRALLALDEFRVYQITMDELEQRTQLHFPEAVKEAGQLTAVRGIAESKPLAALAEIEW